MRYLLLGFCLTVFGCCGSQRQCSADIGAGTNGSRTGPPSNYSGRDNVYYRYIDVHRVELIFEFGYEPTPDEIQDWEKRLCEWDNELCG